MSLIRILEGVLSPPLLETKDADTILFKDGFGDSVALFTRNGTGWIFLTKDDPDWGFELGSFLLRFEDSQCIMDKVKATGCIEVYDSVRKRLLLVTTKATVIECRFESGGLAAVFSRHFNSDMWIFVSLGDPDWESELVRLGYAKPKGSLSDELKRMSEKQT